METNKLADRGWRDTCREVAYFEVFIKVLKESQVIELEVVEASGDEFVHHGGVVTSMITDLVDQVTISPENTPAIVE